MACAVSAGGIDLALHRANTLATENTLLRFTLLTSAVASATFAATLVFAPDILDAVPRISLGQVETVRESAPVVVEQTFNCNSPLGKIVVALRQGDCPTR